MRNALVSIETKRLLLRPFQLGDAPSLHSVVGNDPDMTWDATFRSLAYVEGTVRDRVNHFERHGFGVWAVIEKASKTLVGQCGLQMLSGTDDVELVAYTARRHWREGFATEACRAAMRYGFEELQVPRLLVVTRTDNIRALPLAAKLGFQYVKDDHIYGADVQVWQLQRQTYKTSDDVYVLHRGQSSA